MCIGKEQRKTLHITLAFSGDPVIWCIGQVLGWILVPVMSANQNVIMRNTIPVDIVEDDPCLCAMTYLDGEYKEENVEMMAWKTVRGSYPDTEHVKFRTLPEVTVASCTYQGSYTRITNVYIAVIAWMEANGYEPAEPMFNIYHVSPHETQDPDEFVTEICYPVKKK